MPKPKAYDSNKTNKIGASDSNFSPAQTDATSRYWQLIEASPLGIQVNGTTGIITYSNPAHAKMLGYEPGEIIGKPIWNFYAEQEDQAKLKEYLAYLVKEQPAPTPYAGKHLTKDGREIDVQVDWNYQHDEQGMLIGFSSVITDVSHLKQAEDLLIGQIINSVPVGLSYIDADQIFRFANNIYVNFLGLSPENLIGMTLREALQEKAYQNVKIHIERALAGETVTYENIHPGKNGEDISVLVTNIPDIRSDGVVQGFYASVEDITNLKKIENDMRRSEATKYLIIKNAPDGIALYDVDGTIIEMNEFAASGNSGSVDELIGQNVFERLPADEIARRQSHIQQVISSKKLLRAERERDDGTVAELLIQPVCDDQENVTQIAVFSRDITERKKLEAHMVVTQKMEALGQLTGGIAHEFNNLLMAVTGNLEMALQNLGDKQKLEQYVSSSLQAALRGGILTQHLLSYTGKQTLMPKVTDVNAFMSETVDLLRPSIGEAIELGAAFAADVWPVKVDQGQLQQVILNLAINARDAMPEGGKIGFETANVHIDEAFAETLPFNVKIGDYTRVSVTDTGIGMPPEVLEKVFDPFFTTKGMAEGTGIGMSIVFGLIRKQSGGFIDIDSEVGCAFR